jgi:hypothetical protein
MNTFPADNADMRRLMKNCAADAAHSQGCVAVGLRQKALQQRILIATTASRVFSSLFATIRVYSRLKKGSNPRSSASIRG